MKFKTPERGDKKVAAKSQIRGSMYHSSEKKSLRSKQVLFQTSEKQRKGLQARSRRGIELYVVGAVKE